MSDKRFLINYLPQFMQEYSEMQRIMYTEQDQIDHLWSAADMAFADQFIDTMFEYGLSRWEKMLNINPRSTDTIHSRRIAVKMKLNNNIPYTMKALLQKLEAISDGLPFKVDLLNDEYLLKIFTEWDVHGQIDNLKDLLELVIPANLVIESRNALKSNFSPTMNVASGMSTCEMINISDAGDEFANVSGDLVVPAYPVTCESLFLDDAKDEKCDVTGSNFIPAKGVLAECINLTD